MKNDIVFIEIALFQNDVKRVFFIRYFNSREILITRPYNVISEASKQRLSFIINKDKVALHNSFVSLVYEPKTVVK